MKMQLKPNKFVGCRLHCNRFIVHCSNCFLNACVCGVCAPCSQIKLLQFRCNTIMQRTASIAWTERGCGKKSGRMVSSAISQKLHLRYISDPGIFFTHLATVPSQHAKSTVLVEKKNGNRKQLAVSGSELANGLFKQTSTQE